MTAAISIDKQVYRRFLMGRQGLWPGRRWAGRAGVVQAVRECESIQIDTISVMARSHDIALWGRVADYHPDLLFEVAYADRSLFDYGGVVNYYPMEELPYWRTHMAQRIQAAEQRGEVLRVRVEGLKEDAYLPPPTCRCWRRCGQAASPPRGSPPAPPPPAR